MLCRTHISNMDWVSFSWACLQAFCYSQTTAWRPQLRGSGEKSVDAANKHMLLILWLSSHFPSNKTQYQCILGLWGTTAHLCQLQNFLHPFNGISDFMTWRKHEGTAGSQGKATIPESSDRQKVMQRHDYSLTSRKCHSSSLSPYVSSFRNTLKPSVSTPKWRDNFYSPTWLLSHEVFYSLFLGLNTHITIAQHAVHLIKTAILCCR